MLTQVPERMMHRVRWVLTIAWLLIIASLVYDPWTLLLTIPDHPWSPLRINPNICIKVQETCFSEQPYPLGTTIFWGAIVPAAIFILLIFGHELWRRICPLSFLSQIPRALGWQRQYRRQNPQTGTVRYELAKVKANSWLGKNYPAVQFSWLFIGLAGRILFFDADRLALALWLLGTIACAITVGYLYGGKTWCNYFCPMAPVQQVYSEPGGLLSSKAHLGDQKITQSMCRTIPTDGDQQEQSACVACQNPCIDIDAERAYWDSLEKPATTWLRYGYIGLVVGYFVYYYLYAGNWDYYFSGAWARQTNQLASLLEPGFYLGGQAVNIPKLVAVPLTLGIFTLGGYGLGRGLEQGLQKYSDRVALHHRFRAELPGNLNLQSPHHPFLNLSPEKLRHRIFTILTFSIFNFFFIFGGRPLIQLLPVKFQYLYELGLVSLSTLWLYQTWQRSSSLYARESLASRFRKQLAKLQFDISQFLEGRPLEDLHTNEVYVLAKVLPGFTKEKRHQAYKGVVREALEEGYVNFSSSLGVLKQMRLELGITDDEHQNVLEELGVEDPQLLNPDRQRNLENQVRLSGYRKALERLIMLQKRHQGEDFQQIIQENSPAIRALQRRYAITPQEEDWIMTGLDAGASDVRRYEFLLAQLTDLIAGFQLLHQPAIQGYSAAVKLLQDSIYHKQELIARSLLETLAKLPVDATTLRLAEAFGQLYSLVLVELLEAGVGSDSFSVAEQYHLQPAVLEKLTAIGEQSASCSLELPDLDILAYLERLVDDRNHIIQAVAVYLIAQTHLQIGQEISLGLQFEHHPLVQETGKIILDITPHRLSDRPHAPLSDFPTLEKIVYIYNSDFFQRINNETLMALATRSEVRVYPAGALITEAGDTCRELLLLIDGDAQVQHRLPNGEMQQEQVHPGQTLDELEVLAHSESQSTIVATREDTRILAIPVDTFDDLLDADHDFARRVLELESRQLQKFMRSFQSK